MTHSAESPTLYTIDLAEEEVGDIRGEVDVLGEAHIMNDSTDPPDNPADGQIRYSSGGHDKYASSDTSDYNTGRNTQGATNLLNFTTSFQNIPGIGAQVGIGTYRAHAQILINNPGTASQGALSIQVASGPSFSNGRFSASELIAGTSATASWSNWDVMTGTLTGGNAPGANTNNRTWIIEAYFIVSVAGFFTFQMKQAATAACNTVQYGTFMDIMPVS